MSWGARERGVVLLTLPSMSSAGDGSVRSLPRLQQPAHRVERRIERRPHRSVVPDVARRGPLHARVDKGGALLHDAVDAETGSQRAQGAVPEGVFLFMGHADATAHLVDRVAGAHQGLDLRQAPIAGIMTRDPRTVRAGRMASEAAHLMEQHRINGLIVVDEAGRAVGALNIHDLLRARVV